MEEDFVVELYYLFLFLLYNFDMVKHVSFISFLRTILEMSTLPVPVFFFFFFQSKNRCTTPMVLRIEV